jgi:hypothetical protein
VPAAGINYEKKLFSLGATKMKCSITVLGRIDPARSSWFEGLEIITGETTTLLTGQVTDQAALFGILNRIRDLGLLLEEVKVAEV